MENRGEAKTISREDYKNKSFNLQKNNSTDKVNVRTTFKITENNIQINFATGKVEKDSKMWAVISNKMMEKQINLILKEYKTRTNIIDTIINEIVKDNFNGVIIDFDKIEEGEKETVKRFIVEIVPKLREFGIDTCVVINENFEKNDYINIVDYIIE